MATNMKMTFFWDVAPCSLVEIDLRFRGCLLLPSSSGPYETSANLYGATSQKTTIFILPRVQKDSLTIEIKKVFLPKTKLLHV
jgi:hypothetical protein